MPLHRSKVTGLFLSYGTIHIVQDIEIRISLVSNARPARGIFFIFLSKIIYKIKGRMIYIYIYIYRYCYNITLLIFYD
jgi:hypothetical protein